MTLQNIDPVIQTRINGRLKAIEINEDLTVIYACESGSRAWGFPSLDSDYDVRFLYARPLPWYLAVGQRSDVVEEPVDSSLDLGGWDVKKALGLFRSGNAPLLEWLASPIVYRERTPALAPLRCLIDSAFRPESVCHHYLSLTRRMLARLKETQKVRLKTYFYAVRGLLAARWVIENQKAPPMNLWQLLDGVRQGPWSADDLRPLAELKRRGREAHLTSRLPDLDAMLRQEHDALTERVPKNPTAPAAEVVDAAFLEILQLLKLLPART